MKKSINIALILMILGFGCSQKSEPKDPTVIVAGKIENEDSKEVRLYLDQEIATTEMDDEGNFSLSFEGEESAGYMLIAGRNRFELFISPGDSIYVTVDAKEVPDTYKVQGDHEIENQYLFEKSQTNSKSGLNNLMVLMANPKDEYFIKKDSLFALSKVKFEELKRTEGIDAGFVAREDAYYTYEPLIFDSQYPMYHAHLTKVPQDSIDFPTEDIDAKMAKVPLDQKELLNVRSYTSIVDRVVGKLSSELIKNDSSLKASENAYEKARMIAMDSLLKDPSVKDHFLYNSIKSNMEYRGPSHVKDSYDKFMAENQSPKYAKKLNEIKDKWEPISPGKEVPDFSFVNIEGEEVKLSDLKGQLVYIDIWATWCGPCIAEHPHWDKMKEEYKDKKVAFLTVSIDDNKEPWEKMVKAKNMEGLQWFAENAWKSDLAQHFMVNAIPRFLLLDEEGKVIDPSADRPSGKIRETLEKYL
ncbi:TlpA family protein disulfide reductase [Belliella marina]|uniref:TlpA family protein disulfide reductase n=1 Tax=Belliella marina TaxID=1644146 RepID=A0ABW4VRC5_9BACT